MAQTVWRKYGAAATVTFALTDYGTTDLAAGIGTLETSDGFVAGDVTVLLNEGTAANTANLPVNQGAGLYSLALTATELSTARVYLRVRDQSGPKLWEDEPLIVETYGNASAAHPFDLGTALSAQAVGSVAGSVGSIAANGIASASLAADTDVYTARLWLVDDNNGAVDRWLAAWHRNGAPVTTGITVPTLQVVKAADATDLIAASAMTQVGTTGVYAYNATGSARVLDGAGYLAVVTATIGGSSRTAYQPIGVRS